MISRRTISAIIALCAVMLSASPAKAGDTEFPWLDQISFEDMRGSFRATEKQDFSWYAQKAFVAAILKPKLIDRGFTPKSAAYIASVWDTFRFDPETGQRLYPRPAMKLDKADIGEFAARMPSCLSDIGRSNCRIAHSTEYGCKYDPKHQKICQDNFRLMTSLFGDRYPENPEPKTFMDYNWLFHWGVGCMEIGGRGADLVVFAPAAVKSATKLRFAAIKRGETLVQNISVAAPERPRRDPPLCSALASEPNSAVEYQSAAQAFLSEGQAMFKVFGEDIQLTVRPLSTDDLILR